MILNAFFLAFRQIKRNLLRAILTMLGVIIGVGSVIVMISLGNGTTQSITNNLSSLGSNILLIFPARSVNTGSGGGEWRRFSLQEAEMLKIQMAGMLKAVAPIMNTTSVVQYRQENIQAETLGVDSAYFVATDWKVNLGRSFTDSEFRSGVNSCLLGETVRKNLFKEASPIGSRVKIGAITCECVGVLESKGQGGMGNDQDNVVILPLKAYQRSISRGDSLYNVNRIMLSVNDGIDSTQAVSAITERMRDIRGVRKGQRDNFEIMDTKEILQTIQSTTASLTLFLGAIAGVSLIVGGIGIMNIMLVSVTERTKEIGTRLAIGALQKEVLLQFLIESLTLSALGGLIGIILAFIIAWFVSSFLLNIPFIFDYGIAFGAFIFSALIGVVFGYLPARRASRLNPIEALRHE